MVAVVSGSSLGLFNSSASSLGGDNAANPQVGRGRDRYYVNTTTGNLIIQGVDDTLSALGLDFAALRTYNSQGLTDEDNGDNWRLGVHMRLSAVTGGAGVNTAGSQLTKTFGDGAEVVYTYNTTRARYESNDGDGANDYLTWNGTVWTWTDGSARSTEEYALISGAQRIKFSRDTDLNTVTYNYTGSLLTSLNMANPGAVANNAQTVTFTYTGNNLMSIGVTSWNGTVLATQTLTSYTYDASNRLQTVRVDLTPTITSDSVTYTTTYAYEGTSKRVASITQTDGSSVTFTYQDLNGNYRVRTMTDAEGRVTTFTYNDVIGGGGTPAGWSAAQLIETSPAEVLSPVIAFDANGNGIAAWSYENGDVVARRFDKATNTWGPVVTLRTTPAGTIEYGSFLSLSVDDNGNAVLAWLNNNDDTQVFTVYASRYTAAGNSWSTSAPVMAVSSSVGSVDASMRGSYAAVSWSVHTSSTNAEVYVARWNGTAWSAAMSVETLSGIAQRPSVAVDSTGRITVAWQQPTTVTEFSSIYVNRYNGTSWAGATLLESSATAASDVKLGFDGSGNAIALWTQNTDVFARRYDAATNTWAAATPALDTGSTAVQSPSLSVDVGGNAIAAWIQSDGSALSAYASRYSVATNTWSPAVLVEALAATVQKVETSIAGNQAAVLIGAAGGSIAYRDLYVARWNGATWTTDTISVGGAASAAYESQIAIDTQGYASIVGLGSDAGATSIVARRYSPGSAGGGPAFYQRTQVQDALGLTTTYLKDAQGRLISVQTPAVGGVSIETRYTYDPVTGNVATMTEDPTGLNRVTTFTYDANTGLLLSTRDSLGNTVTRTYNPNNQLETETSYVNRSTTGTPTGTAMVSRYLYDVENHLRFAISADGRVIEHVYNTNGERITTYKYAADTYASTYTEAALNNWATAASGPRSRALERAEYVYDFRSNISTITTWTATTATGTGTGTSSVTRFIYDQRGMLLTTVEARGEATATPTTDYVTNYTYDGLNRARTATTWVSGGEIARPIKSIVYDDANRRTVSTFANGLTSTETFNRSGDLVSVAMGPAALGTKSYTYDSNGRERVVTDQTGVKTYCFYDDAGRKIGYVDGDGSLTELVYNRASQVVKTIRYATLLSATTQTSLAGTGWNTIAFATLRTEANAAPNGNQITRNVYDVSGALVYTLDQPDATIPTVFAVTQNVYDGAGRLTDQIRFFNAQTIAVTVDEVLPSAITVATNASDRRTRSFYNSDGQLTGTLDGAGYLKENVYDAGGRLITQIGYYNASDASRRLTGTLDTLRPGSSGSTAQLDPARDIRTRFFFDAQGRKVGELDGERYLTEQVYDVAGNVTQSTRYNVVLTDAGGTTTFATLRSAAVAAGAATHTTAFTYNGLRRVLTETNFENTQTLYSYDVAGNLISTTRANGAGVEARTTQTRYDVLGRVTQELTAEGTAALAALGGSPTQAQVDDVWNKYSITYTYDNANRRISATVRPNDSQTNTTYFYYDNDGRVRFELDPRGRVTENRYNALGQLVDRIQYWRTVTIASPTGGLLNSTLIGQLSATESANVHEKTTYAYSLRGQIASTLTAAGARTANTYNVFGELLTSNAGSGFTAYDFTYDARGLQKLARRGAVTLQDRSYDAFGRLTSVIDARGNASTTTYDRLGREVASAEAGDANARLTTYDGFARVLTIRDKLLNTTSYSYVDATRTITVTTPEGISVATVHNRHGDDVSVTANGNTTNYTYDLNGRFTGASDGLGALESRAYDRVGRQIEARDARGTITTFTYDAGNRALSRTVDTAGGGLALQTNYAYDPLSRVMTVTEPGNRVTRTEYDRDGRVAAVVVDPSGNASRTEYVYDTANHTTLVTEGAGSTKPRRTQYLFDAFGRRSDEYVDPTSLGGTLNLRTQYRYDNNDNLTRKIDPRGNSGWYVYDAQNRLSQTIDALGGVTLFSYDAEDRVVGTRRYFNTVATGGLGDAPVAQSVTTTLNDQVTRSVFDRDGREKYTISTVSATGSPGAVTETGIVTERTFDAAGSVTRTRVYRIAITVPATVDTASVATALTSAGNSTATLHADDQVTWTAYDLRGQPIFTVDGSGAVSKTTFDLSGNVVSTIAYAERVALGNLMTAASLTTWSTGASIVNNTANRTTKFWFDALNRERFVLDAEGYLSETRFLDSAKQEVLNVYAIKPAIGANATLTDVASAASAAPLQVGIQSTTKTLDVAGRVVQVMDADGRSEYFGYDAVGNKTRYVNKKASGPTDAAYTWTYDYDANHRLTHERSPSVTITTINPTTLVATESTQSLVAFNEYDALGNVTARTEAQGTAQARVTRYEYDLLGHQMATVSPTVGIYNAADGDLQWGNGAAVAVTESQTEVRSEVVYDVFGNVIRSRLVTAMNAATPSFGTFSHKAYDNLGRVRYEIDNQSRVTSYTYDVFGNVAALTRHATPLSTALPTSGNSLTIADVSSRLTTSATSDRTIQKTFDRLGRELSVRQPSVRAFVPATSGVGGSYIDAQPATEYVYDAFGGVLRTSVQINSTEWAHSYSYYDRRGLKTAVLDPKRYLTQFEYDETGDLTRQVEYARPTTGTLDYTTFGTINFTTNATHAVPAPSVSGTPDVFQGYDREVTYTYDRLNRRVTENKRNIEYATLNSPTGVSPGYSGIQTTTYGYDVLGNQTMVKDALGAMTFTFYDTLSRVVGVAQPSRELGLGAAVTGLWPTTARIPFTRMARDAYGNLVQTVEYYRGLDGTAFGATPPPAPALPATPASHADDRTTTIVVDKQGHTVRTRDATGADSYASYNTRRDVVKQWQPVTNAITGASEAIVKIYRYDSMGQQTQLLESQRFNGAGTDFVTRMSEYNGFGEIVAQYNSGTVEAEKEYFDYDATGRVWRTNTGDGVDKVYLYDLAGNATLELRSKTVDLNAGRTSSAAGTYTSAQSVLNAIVQTDLMRTETVYDANSNVVQRRMPTFDIDTRFSPVAASILITTISGQVYVNWQGALNSQIVQGFSYRVAGSTSDWQTLAIQNVSSGVIGANVRGLTASQLYEFRVAYNRAGELMPFAESMGTFRFDLATTTTAVISQTVNPQIPTLANTDHTNGFITWSAPSDTSVTARLRINGSSWISATKPNSSTFQVDVRTPIGTSGSYNWEIEYLRGVDVIAKKTGTLNSQGTVVARTLTPSGAVITTPTPWNGTISNPWATGTGASRTIGWNGAATLANEGPVVAELVYMVAGGGPQTTVNLAHNGSAHTFNVNALAANRYQYVLTYKVGGRQVAQQSGEFTTTDPYTRISAFIDLFTTGAGGSSTPISNITGFAAGPTASWSNLESEQVEQRLNQDTGFLEWYWNGLQWLRPSWGGSQASAWVRIDYTTLTGDPRTWTGTMWRDTENGFTLAESAGYYDIADLPTGGCDSVQRLRVYTAEGGTLIGDSIGGGAGRGITWSSPPGEMTGTAYVYYENGANNWVLIGAASRSADTFTIGTDVVPSGRRIKIEYNNPGENWAYNTAIATYTYSAGSAPVISGVTTSNHDPAMMTLNYSSPNDGTVRWTGTIASGGRMTVEILINDNWQTVQTWTSGSSFAFDFAPYVSTAQFPPDVWYRIQNFGPASAPWPTHRNQGQIRAHRTDTPEPARVTINDAATVNAPSSPATVFSPTMSSTGLAWSRAKDNESDIVRLTYWRQGQATPHVQDLAGAGPAFSSNFPLFADGAVTTVFWRVDYLRAGQTNSYARATGQMTLGVATNTTYASSRINSEALAYPSTATQIPAPTYRQSDRALIFTTAANALSDIQFLFDGVALTVTTESTGGYKVILPSGAANGAHTYSIRYQGAGNPYALASGSITVTNTTGAPSNETISVNAQRAETSLSIAPTIGQTLFVDPPYAIYHQEFLQGGPGGMGPGYYLVLGARPWAPENTSFSGGWYYSTMPSEADPDGAYSQVSQANYTYQADRWVVSWPGSAAWVGIGSNIEIWPIGNPSAITTPTVSRPDGNGFVGDVQNLTPGTYGYRINYTRVGAFAPIGFIEGTLVRGTTNSMTVSASVSPPVVLATPTTSQKFDRWGNVIESVDASGNLTSYRYNGLDLLVQTLEARDYVYDKRDATPIASINGTLERVEKTNSYDILGRLIETQDGYDQANRVTYNAAGQQITKRNADWQRYTGSAVTSNIYDTFGNLIQSTDETGYRTRYKYDKAGRLTEMFREIRLNAFSSAGDPTSTGASVAGTVQRVAMSYDAAGRRITETNGANETVTYSYDFLGNVVRRRTPLAFLTSYVYNFDGKKTQETDAIGGTKSWTYDAFGNLKTHIELTNTTPTIPTGSGGGNVITFNYNFAGHMSSQTSAIGQNIAYSYDRAGNLTSIADTGVGMNRVTSYRYDAAGRMVRESVVADHLLHQDSRYQYDAHNRIARIDDPDYREKILFDVNGNRAFIESFFVNHEARSVSETIRYTYDEMARVTQKAVHNLEGAAVTHFTDLTYNARGDRVLQVADDRRWSVSTGTNRWSDLIQGAAYQVDEAYVYDGLGRLETVNRNLFHTLSGAQNPTNILLHSYGYDLANRRTSEFHRSVGANHITEDRNTTTGYDADGRTTTQTTQKRNDSNVYINESRVTYGSSTYSGGVWSNGFDAANNLRTYQLQTFTAGGGNQFLFTYRNNYLLGDVYLDAGADVSSTGTNHPQDGHNVRTYNVNRELVKFKDLDPAAAEKTQQFTNNQAGQALSTIKGDFESDPAAVWKRILERARSGGQYNTGKAQYFFYAQGNLYGSFGQLVPEGMISGRFDVNSTPISESYPSAVPPTVVTQSGDTLRTIAARVFGDASLWYVIAEENGLTDPDAALGEGQQLRIPNNVLSLSNQSDSFKPFNIGEVMGDTTPSSPPPPAPKSCGIVGQIILIVIAAVITYFTAGAALSVLGPLLGPVLGGAIAAGVGAAAASVVTQGLSIVTGYQDKFSWKQVGASFATAALTFGVGKGFDALNVASQGIGGAVRAVANNAVGQGVNIAFGLQDKFNWRSVAASAVEAPLANYIGNKFPGARLSMNGPGGVGHVLSHAALGAGVAAIRGEDVGAGAIGGATEAFLSGALPPGPPGKVNEALRDGFGQLVAAGLATVAGRDASVAAGAARNAYQNNYLKHKELMLLNEARERLEQNPNDPDLQRTVAAYESLDQERDDALDQALLNRDMKTFRRLSSELAAAADEYLQLGWGKNPYSGSSNYYRTWGLMAEETINRASIYSNLSKNGIDGRSDLTLQGDVAAANRSVHPLDRMWDAPWGQKFHAFSYSRPDREELHGYQQYYARDLVRFVETMDAITASPLGAAAAGYAMGAGKSLDQIHDYAVAGQAVSGAIGSVGQAGIDRGAMRNTALSPYLDGSTIRTPLMSSTMPSADEELSPSAYAWHVSSAKNIGNIAKVGIDPQYLKNGENRFGPGFYVSENAETALAEVLHHERPADSAIRFEINRKAMRPLDFTRSEVAKQWGYTGQGDKAVMQAMGPEALRQGYNTIRFRAERGPGINFVVLADYNKLLQPVMISPTKK